MLSVNVHLHVTPTARVKTSAFKNGDSGALVTLNLDPNGPDTTTVYLTPDQAADLADNLARATWDARRITLEAQAEKELADGKPDPV